MGHGIPGERQPDVSPFAVAPQSWRLQDVPWGWGLSGPRRGATGKEALRTEGAASPSGTDSQGGLGGHDGTSASFPSQHVGRRRARQAGWGESQSCPSSPRISEARALSLLAKKQVIDHVPDAMAITVQSIKTHRWAMGVLSKITKIVDTE